jgi:hypothetical protein
MIPQIDNLKTPEEPLNARRMLPCPTDTPFGNLNRAEMELIARVDFINVRLRELYQAWEKFDEDRKAGFPDKRDPGFYRRMNGVVPHEALWYRLRIEEIVYWIRKTTDTLVALSWILGDRRSTGRFPTCIMVDSIGKVLSKLRASGQGPHIELFRPHESTLRMINDISNTYKHHFVNYDTNLIFGELGPTAYWISMEQNDAQKSVQFNGVLVCDLVARFGRLWADVRAAHRDWLGDSGDVAG